MRLVLTEVRLCVKFGARHPKLPTPPSRGLVPSQAYLLAIRVHRRAQRGGPLKHNVTGRCCQVTGAVMLPQAAVATGLARDARHVSFLAPLIARKLAATSSSSTRK